MNIEQLAITVIIIFAFMGLMQTLKTVRSTKRAGKKSYMGRRRIISSDAIALLIAEGIVTEVSKKHEDLANEALETGLIPQKLEQALSKAQLHFLERVDSRCRGQFYIAVNKIILKK